MFLKKKGPIDVPGGLILLPMFAAHPYNHFCTEYPPPPRKTRKATPEHSDTISLLALTSWNKKLEIHIPCPGYT